MTATQQTQAASAAAGAGVIIASTLASNAPISTKAEVSVGTGLLAAAPFAGPAAPFVAVAGGIASLLGVMGVGSGCGETCVLSSQYADEAEKLLAENQAAYFSVPAPRPLSYKNAALYYFDTVIADMFQQCSNPALGDAGKRCISDRQRGGKWDWYVMHRDPIASDMDVYDDTSVASQTESVLSKAGASISELVTGSGNTGLYIILGIVGLGAFYLFSRSGNGNK